MQHGRVDDALGGELERPQQARERRCRGRRRVELAGGVAGTARQCRDSADPAPLPSWPPPTSQSSRSAPQNPVRCGRRSLRKGGAALKSCGVRTDPRPARPDSRPRWAGRHSCHRRGGTGGTSHLPVRVKFGYERVGVPRKFRGFHPSRSPRALGTRARAQGSGATKAAHGIGQEGARADETRCEAGYWAGGPGGQGWQVRSATLTTTACRLTARRLTVTRSLCRAPSGLFASASTLGAHTFPFGPDGPILEVQRRCSSTVTVCVHGFWLLFMVGHAPL